MNKTVLLTGATGFLGSHLAEKLLAKNYKVLAYHRPQSDFWRVKEFKEQIEWFNLNEGLELPFRQHHKIHHLIHTATNYGRNNEPNSLLVETNLLFPLKLFELATFFNTNTILYKYLNSYALSKKQLCEWLKLFADKTKVINIKLEHIYGAKDDNSKFITYIINQCITNMSQIDLTAGEQKRDLIYIDDAINAYLLLMEKWDSFSESYHSVELGTGKSITIKELVETIAQLTQSSTKLNFGALPYRENEMMESVADISELAQLGWRSEIGILDGLTKMLIKSLVF